jgi:hypothetical protein
MAKTNPKVAPKEAIQQAALEYGRAQAIERLAKVDLERATEAYQNAQKNADLASEALLRLASETA